MTAPNFFYVLVNCVTGSRIKLESTRKETARHEAYKRALLEGWHHAVMHTYKDSSLNLICVSKVRKCEKE